MIQLIADAGSTKTDWRLISEHGIYPFQTEGMNPYFMNDAEIKSKLNAEVLSRITQYKIDRVHFYGAGCAADANKDKIREAFNQLLPKASIEIETDLLGAARAILGKREGFVAILGTGTNTGWYNGKIIAKQVDSLGYVLGDEGSGASIGKYLLTDYLRNTFSDDLSESFRTFCPLSRDEILEKVYKQPHPNRFLASFVHFAAKHIDDEYIQLVIKYCFGYFLRNIVDVYFDGQHEVLNFSGSVASLFKKIMIELLEGDGYLAGTFISSPIEELVKFHLHET